MQAGKLDRFLRIERKVETRNDFNEKVLGWELVAEIWATVKDLSGREYLQSGAIQSEVKTKIFLRYRAGVEAGMRVVDGGDIYNIEAVLGRDRRSNMLTLMCSRGVNNG